LGSPNINLVWKWLQQTIDEIGERRFGEIVGGLNRPTANESTD